MSSQRPTAIIDDGIKRLVTLHCLPESRCNTELTKLAPGHDRKQISAVEAFRMVDEEVNDHARELSDVLCDYCYPEDTS